MQLKEYLRLFNLNENYTRSQLRQSYLKLIKQYHPDTHPGDKKAIEMTQKINASYDFLLNNLKNRPPVNNFYNSSQEQKKNSDTRKSSYQKQEKTKTAPVKNSKSINEIYEELAEILGKDVPVPDKIKETTLYYEYIILEAFNSIELELFEVFKSNLYIILKKYIEEVNQILGSKFEYKENDTFKTIKIRVYKLSKIKEQIDKILSKYTNQINRYPVIKPSIERMKKNTINLLLEKSLSNWDSILNKFDNDINHLIEKEKVYEKIFESFYKNIVNENIKLNDNIIKDYYTNTKENIIDDKNYNVKKNKKY